MATVQFPTGERTVPLDSLELRVTDPFELLGAAEFGDEPEWFDIRLRAARLQAAYGSDNLSGLVNSRVILRPHQIFVAHRVLEKPRPSMILADEVGLGKTVEAGLVLKELLARRSIKRILVVVPPNLLNQWHTELRIKFNEIFEIVDSALLKRTRTLYPNTNPFLQFNRVLLSSYMARDSALRAELADGEWGLVILDEAHHCRRKLEGNKVVATELYKTFDQLKDDAFGVLLLTATPMQLHPFELFSLVEIVEPGLYSGYDDFEDQVIASTDLRECVKGLQGWDELPPADRRRTEQLLANQGMLGGDLSNPVVRDEKVEKLLEILRLPQAIVRNRKRTVGGFTRRIAKTIPVDLSPTEQDLHRLLEAYLRAGFDSARRARDTLLGLELVTYQRLAASSSRALARALLGRRNDLNEAQEALEALTDEPEDQVRSRTLALPTVKGELQALDELIETAMSVDDTKVSALVELVDAILKADKTEKILVFTQFLATQHLIAEKLAEHQVVVFNGGLTRWEKDEVVRKFRTEAQVMVSTESGGEGRNFQFCRNLINFDLHWNPMRIEQRIGRLDRYGQKRNVHIYNLAARGTIEERLIEVLTNRLNMFEKTVGALELILGDVEDDLRKAVLEAAGNVARATEIFERSFDQRLRDAERVEEKSPDFLIEIGSFQKDVAERLTTDLREGRVRVDLEVLVLHVLDYFPTAKVEVSGDVYRIEVPPALPSSVGRQLERTYVGTFAAGVAVEDESIDFFGFGHPLVDTCLVYAASGAEKGLAAIRRLPQGVLTEPALEVNYLLEFSGVRKWASVESIVIDLGGRRIREAESKLRLAETITDSSTPGFSVPVQLVRDRAVEEMRRVTDKRRPEVLAINEERAKQEVYRAKRIDAYNKRRIQDRITALQERIRRLETEGNPESQRIIPVWRHDIDGFANELAGAEADLQNKLRELEKLKSVSEAFTLVSVAMLVPS
jgi:ERCC4-related helicase